MTIAPFNAIILAGSRPGVDPFADANGVQFKALIPVGGKPMLTYVAAALTTHPDIGTIKILAQETGPLQLAVDHLDPEKIGFAKSKSTIAASIEMLLNNADIPFPQIITTADNVLLDSAMIDHFCAAVAGSDIAIAVVEKRTLLAHYPESRRTWLKFRGGYFSGANLFCFGSKKACSILRYWAEVEQDRKKGWKVLSIFGPWLLFLAMTHLISIDQLAERMGRKLGLKVAIVKMPQAEACIDVDKQSDLELVESILRKRGQSAV